MFKEGWAFGNERLHRWLVMEVQPRSEDFQLQGKDSIVEDSPQAEAVRNVSKDYDTGILSSLHSRYWLRSVGFRGWHASV